jgi:hypothetical protein
MLVNDKARENMAYVRRLLRHRQPGFAKTLESAVMLAERELHGSRPLKLDTLRQRQGAARGSLATLAPVRDGAVPRAHLLWAAALLLTVIADDAALVAELAGLLDDVKGQRLRPPNRPGQPSAPPGSRPATERDT